MVYFNKPTAQLLVTTLQHRLRSLEQCGFLTTINVYRYRYPRRVSVCVCVLIFFSYIILFSFFRRCIVLNNWDIVSPSPRSILHRSSSNSNSLLQQLQTAAAVIIIFYYYFANAPFARCVRSKNNIFYTGRHDARNS